MVTRPHLSQIQSSDPLKYEHLLEEILDVNSSIASLVELGTYAIVDTYEDLLGIEDKQIGFYLVRNDETYRNNPTHYFYEGTTFKMVGGRVPDGLLKKTIVFYINRLIEEGQSMQLYIPYKGYMNNVTVCTKSDSELAFRLWDGENLIDEFETDTLFMGWDIYHEINNPIIKLEIIRGEVGIENININIDVVIED